MGAAILPKILEVFGMPVTGVDNGMMACGLTLRISTPVVQATLLLEWFTDVASTTT